MSVESSAPQMSAEELKILNERRRPIAVRDTALARRVTNIAVQFGLTANGISVLSVVASLIGMFTLMHVSNSDHPGTLERQ